MLFLLGTRLFYMPIDPFDQPISSVDELNDLSPMPFGKHKGEPMQDVPADYFHWCWTTNVGGPTLRAYIKKSLSALKQETPDRIW